MRYRAAIASVVMGIAMLVGILPAAPASAKANGSQTWYINSSTDYLTRDVNSPTLNREYLKRQFRPDSATAAQSDCVFPAGTWTGRLMFSANVSGGLDFSIGIMDSGTGWADNVSKGSQHLDLDNATEANLSIPVDGFTLHQYGYFYLYWSNPSNSGYTMNLRTGSYNSYIASPSSDPGYPNPTAATPPNVTTEFAIGVDATSVQLKGAVWDKGSAYLVEMSFEWGSDPAYGQTTSVQRHNYAGPFTYTLTGLTPGANYHYRAKAVGDGTVYGADQTFSTPETPLRYLYGFGSYGTGISQFDSPMDVAIDSSGNVYVADNWNYRIQKFSNSGAYTTQWTTYQSDNASTFRPQSLSVDGGGNVYVLSGSDVVKYNSSGTYVTRWGSDGTGNGQLSGAYGIAADAGGNVYVADTFNYRVQKFTGSGVYVAKWGSYGTADGQFQTPYAIAADSAGNVYVTDASGGSFQKFDGNGNFLAKVVRNATGDGSILGAYGLDTDASGNVFIASGYDNWVVQYNHYLNYVAQWSSSGSGPGQLSSPRGIAVDSSGRVFVADTNNHRVQVFGPAAAPSVTTVGTANVTATTAVLRGSLSSRGSAASVTASFVYGASADNYTAETSTTVLGSPVTFTASLSGLTMGATYHYRAKAVGDGTAYGDDLFFTTPVPPPYGKIAFTSNRDGHDQIYVMDVNGGNQARISNNNASERRPALSPDGKKIAFASNRDGNWEIYIMNVDGSGQTRLTDTAADEDDPAWSRDGSKIAFASYRDGNWEIYVMNANGTNQVRLTDNPALDASPAWSPDGNTIAFRSTRAAPGNSQIWVVDAGGGTPAQKTSSPGDDMYPAWSPDGTTIAFMSNSTANNDIYLINATGSPYQVHITNHPASDMYPTWSPDTLRLAFTSNRDGSFEIYRMNTNGDGLVRLTDNTYSDQSPSWSVGEWVAPTATTDNATAITAGSAVLNGNLTALGTATSANVSFQWGLSDNYTGETMTASVNATGAFSANISGLSPGATYHFRARAVGNGTSYGSGQSFTTAPAGVTLIGTIKQGPAVYEGKTVTISGQYRGWEGGHGSPPITRSDWVVSDATGSIYVTGSSAGSRYPDDLGKPLTINGTIRLRNGQPYIEVLPTPPRVYTGMATSLTANTARLGGSIASLGAAAAASVSFQWGASPGNYTGETTPMVVWAAGQFRFDLAGLVPGKTYYFRAKAVGDTEAYGNEMTLVTPMVVYSLTVNVVGNGSVSPTGTTTYTHGTVVSATATPATGWRFDHWSGDASGSFNPIAIIMSGSKTITANFVLQDVTIAAIQANPAAYNGQAVKISGEYRGSEGGHGTPPVSRNDWIIKDNTGSMYVTGSSLGLTYPGDVGKPVTVNGVVRLKSGRPYIEISRK